MINFIYENIEISLLVFFHLIYFLIYLFEAKHDCEIIEIKNIGYDLWKKVPQKDKLHEDLYDDLVSLFDKAEHFTDAFSYAFIHIGMSILTLFLLPLKQVILLFFIGLMVRWIIHDGFINIFRKLPWCNSFTVDGKYDKFDAILVFIEKKLFLNPSILKIMILILLNILFIYWV